MLLNSSWSVIKRKHLIWYLLINKFKVKQELYFFTTSRQKTCRFYVKNVLQMNRTQVRLDYKKGWTFAIIYRSNIYLWISQPKEQNNFQMVLQRLIKKLHWIKRSQKQKVTIIFLFKKNLKTKDNRALLPQKTCRTK